MTPSSSDGIGGRARGGDLRLILGSPSRHTSIECVLDLDSEGAVIGVEILGAMAEAGLARVPDFDVATDAGVLSISLDGETDALYVRLLPGTSSRQVVRSAVVGLTDDGLLAEIRVQHPR